MARVRPLAVLLLLVASAPPAVGADGLDATVRALATTAQDISPAGVDLAAGPGGGPSGWLVRREGQRIEQIFLVETLQVVRSNLPLLPGLGLAASAYDVLGGRKSPADLVAGYVGGQAVDAVYVGVHTAMLSLAAKATAGGGVLSGTAAAPGAMTAVQAGAASPGLWGELILFGAVGAATMATAAAAALAGWGWRYHRDTAWRSAEAEGLLRGAERLATGGRLPAR